MPKKYKIELIDKKRFTKYKTPNKTKEDWIKYLGAKFDQDKLVGFKDEKNCCKFPILLCKATKINGEMHILAPLVKTNKASKHLGDYMTFGIRFDSVFSLESYDHKKDKSESLVVFCFGNDYQERRRTDYIYLTKKEWEEMARIYKPPSIEKQTVKDN